VENQYTVTIEELMKVKNVGGEYFVLKSALPCHEGLEKSTYVPERVVESISQEIRVNYIDQRYFIVP
jgi:hypothetical protein